MSGIVTFKDRIFAFATEGDSSLSWIATNIRLPSSIVLTSAAGPKKVVYWVNAHDPSQIQTYDTETGKVSTFIDVPLPIKKLLFFHERLYALSKDGSCIVFVDMHAKVWDTFTLSCGEVLSMHPADHGFVLVEAKDHSIVSFHFTDGFTPVSSLGSRVRVLGSIKRKVLVLDTYDQLYTVTECGEVEKVPDQSPWSFPPRCFPFFASKSLVVVGDVMIGEDVEEGHALRVFYRKGENKNKSDELMVSPALRLPGVYEEEGPLCISAFPVEKEDGEEDVCPLCFCELEDDGNGLTLDCGHFFHRECAEMWVRNWDAFREKGEHVAFTNAMCPSGCKHLLRHILLPQSTRIASYYSAVREGKAALIATQYRNKTEDELLYYICNACQMPFFGGEKICYRMLGSEPSKCPEDLICLNCEPYSCTTHGKQFLLYKCYFCCNPATHRSFGNRYLCDRCFQSWEKSDIEPQPCVVKDCPWKGKHPVSPTTPPHPVGCLPCLIIFGILDVSKIVPPPPKRSSEE